MRMRYVKIYRRSSRFVAYLPTDEILRRRVLHRKGTLFELGKGIQPRLGCRL